MVWLQLPSVRVVCYTAVDSWNSTHTASRHQRETAPSGSTANWPVGRMAGTLLNDLGQLRAPRGLARLEETTEKTLALVTRSPDLREVREGVQEEAQCMRVGQTGGESRSS